MSLIQKIPLWKENENWRARQQAMRDQMDVLDELTSNLSTANADQYFGLANLVGQAALKRVQNTANARSAELAAIHAQESANDKALQAVKDRMNSYLVNITI